MTFDEWWSEHGRDSGGILDTLKLCRAAWNAAAAELDKANAEVQRLDRALHATAVREKDLEKELAGARGLLHEFTCDRRAEFAARAMQGLLASEWGNRQNAASAAKEAVACADALLAELAK